MTTALADYFSNLNVSLFVFASLPLIAGIAVWISFYIRYDRNVLNKLTWTFRRIANCAGDFTKYRLENLRTMNEVAIDLTTPQFRAAWSKMMNQVEHRYTEEIIPEGECFFRQEVLITEPSRRESLNTVGWTVLVLTVLSILLPAIAAAMFMPKLAGLGLTEGLLPAALLLIGHLIFIGLDRRMFHTTMEAYHQFLYAFDTVLPTADAAAGPALLLDATRKNQKAFELLTEKMSESFTYNAEKIASAIDDFSNGGVLPAMRETMETLTKDFIVPATAEIRDKLDQTLNEVTERQELGMQELASSFASRLAGTLEVRINTLAKALEQYQNQVAEQNSLYQAKVEDQNSLYQAKVEEQNSEYQRKVDEQNAQYQSRIDQLNGLLTENIKGLLDFNGKQNLSLERTEEILCRSEQLRLEEAENAAQFNENVDKMLKVTEKFRGLTDQFTQDTIQFMEKSTQGQMHFTSLVAEITKQMQGAMEGAGKEIAEGINQAVGDNAKAIANLTEQAQALREDYETFYARSDEFTKQTLEEMDYQVQGLITRMSEDVGAILNAAITKNGEILAQYKDQTADLLQSFDEQSRSIGLYAKEINMDISELSTNLGTAVSEFNEKIREGIQLSIGEFDSGLAELTVRIANTVESIVDAVETIPASLKIKETGR